MEANSPSTAQRVEGVGGVIFYRGFTKREQIAKELLVELMKRDDLTILEAVDRAVSATDSLILRLTIPKKKKRHVKKIQAKRLSALQHRSGEESIQDPSKGDSECSYRWGKDGSLFEDCG